MNLKVAINLYQHSWLIERYAALALLDELDRFKNSAATWTGRRFKSFDDDEGEAKSVNSYELKQTMYAGEGVVFAPDNKYDMYDFKGFDKAKVAVIAFEGPLMKGDFCGSFGTASLTNMIIMAAQSKSVETIITTWDTPGGMVNGTASLSEAIRAASEVYGKNTISHVQGMACSAGYWGSSSSREVVLSAATDIVGSIGTMASWVDHSEASKKQGYVLREYYADRSTDKNRAFSEADKGNGRILIEELLNPMNNAFLKAVQEHRSGKIDLKKHDVLTGKTYVGETAIEVGLADSIQSFEQTLNTAMKMAPNKTKTKMSMSQTLPFKTVLTTAQAEAFEVVEGGFLVTEQHLTLINSALEQNQTVIKATSAHLKTLQDSGTDNTALQQELATAKADLATATSKVAALEGNVKKLEAAAANYQGAAQDFFGGAGKNDDDPAQAHQDTLDVDISQFEHNKAVDDLIG